MNMQEHLKHWKLVTNALGRQYWEFSEEAVCDDWQQADLSFDKNKNANSADKWYRFLKTSKFHTKPDEEIRLPPDWQEDKSKLKAGRALYRGIDFYTKLLTPEGFIPGDYGGPMFLMPGLIIVSHITDTPLAYAQKQLMIHYMLQHQHEDGGWGLHTEGTSTMIGSGLQYVALRLLGVAADHPQMLKAREWILANGSATHIPSWGKFYLSTLGVYDWKGCNSLLPEIWLLPEWLPIHPWRYWCHARMVYLPMAYCYGNKITAKKSQLILDIRKEIYAVDYSLVDWAAARDQCCVKDIYHKPSSVMKLMNAITNTYEGMLIKSLRKKALAFILSYIHGEDAQTSYINIGPVNQAINSLAVWHGEGKDSEKFNKHVDRWKDYLWIAEDGMKMQGYNGAQLWETAFTMNAIYESGLADHFRQDLQNMYAFVERSQILRSFAPNESFYRHQPTGGWPFSTVEHGWPITDCSGDGLKASLLMHKYFLKINYVPEKIVTEERMQQCVDLMLSFQSEDGGWASYEIRRAPEWLELLNPSEIFGEIMVDYSYVECTSSTIQALYKFKEQYPNYKSKQISRQIEAGIQFIKNKQREDGSWYGSWGVCFTYAAWFALEALSLNGEDYHNSITVKKACDFLLSTKRADGTWGESYESCVQLKYIQHQDAQIINTAWAVLSLTAAKYPDKEVVQLAVEFLMARQEANGDFPQEGISGVFNKNCMETYTSYRNVFPLWAIGRWLNQ